MKKTVLAVLITMASFQLAVAQTSPAPARGQAPAAPAAATAPAQPAPGTNPLVDYMRQVKYDGFTMSILLVNDRTADLLFQPPTRQAMKARSHQETVLYVQGTPQKDFDLSTAFSITQGTETIDGKATSFKGFVTGKAPAGQRIDGVVEFPKKFDISKPFTVKNGATEVQFALTDEAIKALAPPPAPAP